VLCEFAECSHSYDRLFVYNAQDRRLRQLVTAQAARRYFADHDPRARNGCPAGYPGYGVEVF